MMGRKYQVISGDGHVETPPESWVKYVPEKWQPRAPRLIPLPEGGEGWIIEGQPMLHNGQNITGRGPIKFRNASYYKNDGSPAEGAGDAVQRLREQDHDGIDAEVLFPPVFASRFLEGIRDKEVYVSMIQAYNTFLADDYCAVAPDRLIGNAVLPVTGLEDAIAELERVHRMGLRSVSFYQFPNGSGEPKPEDDQFWAKCLELDMCISPHFGFGDLRAAPAPAGAGTGSQPFAMAVSQRAGTHAPVWCMIQIIANGVLDRFPELQMYFAETNISWLPGTLFFIDDSYELFKGAYQKKFAMKPSEYCLQHFHWGIIRDDIAPKMADLLPWDRIMWGSDFPHSVGSYPNSTPWLSEKFTVSDDVKRKVLLTNPAAYFGLDLDQDITPTPT